MYGLRRRKSIKLLGLVVSIIIIDQLSKFFVASGLPYQEGGFLQATCNFNIAWGIPLEGSLFFAVWTISFLIILYIAKIHQWNIFLIMVIAGAISNIIDKLRLGCVVDFISIGSFPVFNVADSIITIGIIFFILSIIKTKRKI